MTLRMEYNDLIPVNGCKQVLHRDPLTTPDDKGAVDLQHLAQKCLVTVVTSVSVVHHLSSGVCRGYCL